MCPLADVKAAGEVLDQLIAKGLVEPLTPPGRGQTFAHTLYPPDERQHLEAKVAKQAAVASPQVKESKEVIDKLVERLDSVNERIDALEQRLKDLES